MAVLWVAPAAAQPTCPALVSQLKTADGNDRVTLLQDGVAACCAPAQGPTGPFFCGLVQHDLGHFAEAGRQYQLYLAGPDTGFGAQGKRADAGSWLAYASQGKFRDGTTPPAVEKVAPPTEAPPPAPSMFALTVKCGPADAQVMIDAKAYGTCATGPLQVSPGRHQVEVRAPGFITQTQSADLRRDMTLVMRLEPVPPPESSVAPWLLGGAGAVAMGVGGWFHAENFSHFDTLKDSRSRGVENLGLADQVDSDRAYAIGSYVVGSVLLTAAITWLLWPDGTEGAE